MGFIMGSNLIWVISNFIHNAWTQVISGLRNVLSSTLESYSSALGQFLLSALMFVNLHVGDITLVLLTRSLNCSTKCFPLWNPLLIAMVGNYMLFFIRLSNSSLIFRAKWSNCSQIAKMQHVTLGCSVSLWKLFSFEPLIICLLKLSGSQGLSEYVLLANKSYWFWQLECSSRFFFKYISSLFGPFGTSFTTTTTSAQRKASLRMCERVLCKTERCLVDGEDGKQCFEVVIRVSRLRLVVTFFCAILRLLSLGYLFGYLRR